MLFTVLLNSLIKSVCKPTHNFAITYLDAETVQGQLSRISAVNVTEMFFTWMSVMIKAYLVHPHELSIHLTQPTCNRSNGHLFIPDNIYQQNLSYVLELSLLIRMLIKPFRQHKNTQRAQNYNENDLLVIYFSIFRFP